MSEFIGLHLAQHGIPSDIDYDVAGDYEVDPWRPAPGSEVIRITIPLGEADRLSKLLELESKGTGPRCNCGSALLVAADGHGVLREVDHLDWCNVKETSPET